MSARTQRNWDYIAHVQTDGGKVIELAGTMSEWSAKRVYSELMQKATEYGGWLLSQHISESDDDDESPFIDGEYEVIPQLPAPVEETAVVDEEVATVLGAKEYFGEWNGEYKGASLCTFKETGT